MRTILCTTAVALLTATALSGCSKPATPAAVADSAAAPGGAVSAPQAPGNGAVNADANKNDASQTPGSNSFTETQAREHLKNAGYSDVSGLTKTADGLWMGKAAKGGKTMDVSVDFKGAISAK